MIEGDHPESRTSEQLLAELERHLEDLDRDEAQLRDERERTKAAITALRPRRKPGRPAKLAA